MRYRLVLFVLLMTSSFLAAVPTLSRAVDATTFAANGDGTLIEREYCQYIDTTAVAVGYMGRQWVSSYLQDYRQGTLGNECYVGLRAAIKTGTSATVQVTVMFRQDGGDEYCTFEPITISNSTPQLYILKEPFLYHYGFTGTVYLSVRTTLAATEIWVYPPPRCSAISDGTYLTINYYNPFPLNSADHLSPVPAGHSPPGTGISWGGLKAIYREQ